MVEFEFNVDKSRVNKEKHGIDFVEGQALWDDLDLIEINANTTDEPRFLEIGKIGDTFWSAIITYRDEKIRIISIRSSREKEKALYESK
jgi:uncharacterized DUF497 family protein